MVLSAFVRWILHCHKYKVEYNEFGMMKVI